MISGFGISPIGWSNDDVHSLGDDISLEKCLTDARRAGYGGVELGRKFPRKAEELQAVLSQHKLKLVSGWYSGELLAREVEEEKARITEQLELFKSLGVAMIIYGEVYGSVQSNRERPLASRPRLDRAQLKEYGIKLDKLASHCQEQGVDLVFHHHMGTVVETADEVDVLMAATDKEVVHLLFDTGHMLFAGGELVFVLRRHIGRVRHFHAKDLRTEVLAQIDRTRDSFIDCVLKGIFTVPGSGMIDYQPLLAVLAEHSYDGWLVVEAEQDPCKADPYVYAHKGFSHLEALARAQRLTGYSIA